MGAIIYKEGKVIHVKSGREPETKPAVDPVNHDDEPKLSRREQKRQRREAAQRDQEAH